MRSQDVPAPRFKRTPVVLAGVAVALLIGVVAVLSGLLPLVGPANAADKAAAIPNVLTGVSSLAGGIGYLLGRKWGVGVYALSVLGHFAVHGAFLLASLSSNRFLPFTALTLSAVPLATLLVLITMIWQWRQGRLS